MKTVAVGVLLFITCLATGQRVQNFNQVGLEWMQKFYAAFDSTPRGALRDFYDGSDSILVFNGEILYGVDKIMEKYNNISTVVKRNVTSTDFQPTNDGGVIVNVFGKILLTVNVNDNASWFNEMFVFKPRVTAFFIQNHQFRMSRMLGNNDTDVLHFV